jgi:plastocyanin
MRIIVVTALALVAAGCGGSDSGTPTPPPTSTNKTVDVVTDQENFVQPFVTLVAGDTVRWTFQKSSTDGRGHNVRFNPPIAGAPANIGSSGSPITSGKQTRVFQTKGDFHYVCDVHGGMTGEVIVE